VTRQFIVLWNRSRPHPEEAVKVNGFVAMGLNLDDAATKNLNELLPLQLFREIVKALPSSSQGLFAVRVLGFFDLSSFVVPMTLCE